MNFTNYRFYDDDVSHLWVFFALYFVRYVCLCNLYYFAQYGVVLRLLVSCFCLSSKMYATFTVDTEKAGSDNISCTVVREEDQGTFDHNMRFLSHHRFEIEHTPYILGYVNVSVFCEDVEIPGKILEKKNT